MTYDTSRLKDLAISETGFIFDPMSGATFTVNTAAAGGNASLIGMRD